MRLIIVVFSLACVIAHPDGGYTSGRRGYGGGSSGGGGYGTSETTCSGNQIPDANGVCMEPEVLNNVFVYSAPEIPAPYVPSPSVPKPKVEYNVVFVRTPEQPEDPEPIVVPPPKQKTVVYVLTKNGEVEQKVIEIPARPGQSPQVYYVNYNEGDNPTLAGGLTLKEVLSREGQQGQSVGGNGGGFSGGYGGSSGGSGNSYGNNVGNTGGGGGGRYSTGGSDPTPVYIPSSNYF